MKRSDVGLGLRARRPYGRIAIANADSAASAMLEAAIEQAHRAVTELRSSQVGV